MMGKLLLATMHMAATMHATGCWLAAPALLGRMRIGCLMAPVGRRSVAGDQK